MTRYPDPPSSAPSADPSSGPSSGRSSGWEAVELVRLIPAAPAPELPADHRLALRQRFQAQLAQPEHTVPRRRLVLAGAGLAGAAAAAVLVATLPTAGHQPSYPSAAGSPVSPLPSPSTVAPGPALLENIALAALSRTSAPVRDNQFVYIDSLVAYSGGYPGPNGTTRYVLDRPHRRQIWTSVDGSRPGWLIEAATAHKRRLSISMDAGRGSLADPTYRYLQSLSTDPATLLAYIYANNNSEGSTPDERAFSSIGDLLRESLTPPQLTSALYRAAALIPGVLAVPDAVDAAGRHGIAVALTEGGGVAELRWIFDRGTLAYLGQAEVQLVTTRDAKAGTVFGCWAVLHRAVVDRPRQLPPGVR